MNNKKKAREAANREVRAGRMPRVRTQTCTCGGAAGSYHHHKGYNKKHWLDVIPLCRKCHSLEHIADNANLKLSADDVRKIKRLKSGGMKLANIAKQFGVGKSTITSIASGKSYRWVK